MDVTLRQLLDLDSADYGGFDRYVVTGFLGEGAKAKVLLGRDLSLQREVAIKLSAASVIDADESMRFYREAKALSEIDHPNVVRVLDYSGPKCPAPFLVIERLRGVDLQTMVQGQPLTEAQVCAVGFMLASAMTAMHARGIIHRDIKPENAMLTDAGRVVLIDFGFCKGFRTDALLHGETFVDKPTKCVGTPAFSSPEQLRGRHLTKSSDVFSLAATLYFLASEVLPFAADSLIQLIDMVVRQDPFPLSSITSVSPELDQLLRAGFEKDPEKRVRLCDTIKTDLFRLAARSGLPPEDVLTTLAQERNVTQRITHVLDELGTDVLAMRRALSIDTVELLQEETQWAARHAPEATRVVARAETEIARSQTKPMPELKRLRAEKARQRKRVSAKLVAALSASALIIIAALAVLVVAGRGQREPAAFVITAAPAPAMPLPEPQLAPSTVRLAVKPWGKVSVDGQERGTTPVLRVLELNPGTHHFVVENPQHGRLERDVEIASGAVEMLLQFDFSNR